MADDLGSLFDLLNDIMGNAPPEAMLGLLHACIDDLEEGNDRYGMMPSLGTFAAVTLH